MFKVNLYFLVFFSFYSAVFSQENGELDSVVDKLTGLDYNLAKNQADDLNQSILRDELFLLISILENRGQKKLEDSLAIVSHEKKIDATQKFSIVFDIAKAYNFLYNSKNYNLSLKYANKAYLEAIKLELKPLIKLSTLCILDIYKTQPILSTESYKPYLKKLKAYRETKNDSISYLYYFNEFLSLSYPMPENYFKISNRLYQKLNDSLSLHYRARYYEATGVKFRLEAKSTENEKKIDSAKKYFIAATQLEEKNFLRPYKFHSYLELGHLNALSNDRKKAYDYRNRALNYIDKADTLISLYQYYKWDAYYIHEVLKDLDSSFYALDKAFILSTDLNFFNETKQLAELNVELDTAEKEKQLLIQTQKKKQNRNIAIGLGGSLALGSIIVLLVYKNKKRKQELMLQDKELKEKELTSKLKEQELVSINAMIEGQEKERLAIANDLHDDLGSLMATIKLHFGSFKDSKTSQDLFLKTNTLIDEAYHKIRNISHAKNSGVLAKQGLYEAILKLSKSISDSESITVHVHENGLSQRLENSQELTIFRIIQELITNVIKHARATEINIHFTEYDQVLNIMVEDNGIGFDTSQNNKKNSGIGLLSIERRVEKLDGKMIIESQPGNGTTIIIDIPI